MLTLFVLKLGYYDLREAVAILPTNEQALECVYLCQSLTNTYRPIYLVRLDERDGSIFILAGDDLQIVINRNGQWEFLS